MRAVFKKMFLFLVAAAILWAAVRTLQERYRHLEFEDEGRDYNGF